MGYERFIGKVSPRLTLISMDIERLQGNIEAALTKGGMTVREYECLKNLAKVLGETAYTLSKEYEKDGEHGEDGDSTE